MGTKVGIVVSSPSAAREMLRDHDITFANRDVSELASAAVAKGPLITVGDFDSALHLSLLGDQRWPLDGFASGTVEVDFAVGGDNREE
ncbi:hypothetical protein LOK49_LG11G02487 [Camellia lanceoleosa]|uniref:Uncharacterized protein n=1 Tax=Camellia lanceoleosa TaxID=1840588 RepID=A0ACC0FXB9_9ERIC|nr:hypothetical protein LOK49_LG11G02487 [Camellia lanceoleosa]